MNFFKHGLILSAAILILSGCEKTVDVIKNPNIPLAPVNNPQAGYQGVGIFNAYEDGSATQTDTPPVGSNEEAGYYTEGVLTVFGIDKDGKTIEMKDQDDNLLSGRYIVNFYNVKSGVIFTTSRMSDNLIETYFTADGKTAKKLNESIRFYTPYNTEQGFKIPEQKDYEYFCSSQNSLLKWDDKNKILTEQSVGYTFNSCYMYSANGNNLMVTNNYAWMMTGSVKVVDITTSSEGETNLNVVIEKSVMPFSYYDISGVFKIKNKIFSMNRGTGVLNGNTQGLFKTDITTKEETLVKDFSEESSYGYAYANLQFAGKAINGKIYIAATTSVEIPETQFPVVGEYDPSNSWVTTSANVLSVFSVNQEGILTKEYSDARPFVNYGVIKSGNQIYVSQEEQSGIADGSGGYTSSYTLKLYNLTGENVYTIAVNQGEWYNLMNLGSDSVIGVFKTKENGSTQMKYYIPSAIAGGELVTNSNFEPIDLNQGNFFMYYDKVMYSILRKDSNSFELGLVNLDGTLNAFPQINASFGNTK